MEKYPLSDREIKTHFRQRVEGTFEEKRAYLRGRVQQMESLLPERMRSEYLAFAEKTKTETFDRLHKQQQKDYAGRYDSAYRSALLRAQQEDRIAPRPKGMPGKSQRELETGADKAAKGQVAIIEKSEKDRAEVAVLEKLVDSLNQRQRAIAQQGQQREEERGKAKEAFNSAARNRRIER